MSNNLGISSYRKQTYFISLREHAKNIINFEKKKMLPFANEELKSHQDAKVCYIFRKINFKKSR